jgi:hypothetical protein
MAILFLQAINATLKRVGEIAGDSQELATSTVTSTATGLTATEAFTDSRRQHKIDVAIQLWNEATHEVYSMGLMAREGASATLTLVDAQREYDLPSDFERMAGDSYETRALRGATTGLIVRAYPGGYAQMLVDQPTASDYTGDPTFYALSPTLSKIRLNAEPTSGQAGHTYNFLYEKRLSLTSTMATETLPYSDTVADCLVPVVAESYHRVFKKDYDQNFLRLSLTRSLKFLTQTQPRDRYGKRRP